MSSLWAVVCCDPLLIPCISYKAVGRILAGSPILLSELTWCVNVHVGLRSG